MSAFPIKRGATMVTKEEARAAVETEIALNLTRPTTPAEEDEFCQIAHGRLNYQSNTDQTREIPGFETLGWAYSGGQL